MRRDSGAVAVHALSALASVGVVGAAMAASEGTGIVTQVLSKIAEILDLLGLGWILAGLSLWWAVYTWGQRKRDRRRMSDVEGASSAATLAEAVRVQDARIKSLEEWYTGLSDRLFAQMDLKLAVISDEQTKRHKRIRGSLDRLEYRTVYILASVTGKDKMDVAQMLAEEEDDGQVAALRKIFGQREENGGPDG